MIRRFLLWLFRDYIEDALQKHVDDITKLEDALKTKYDTTAPFYTTIRSFAGWNPEYYGWVCDLIKSEQYKFFIFDLRENTIREFVKIKDGSEIIRSQGRLEMIEILTNYLLRYKHEYEAELQRNKK